MFRKFAVALAAVAALGVTALSAADASAKGWGKGWGGGFHHHHHHGHFRHFGRFGFYGATAYAVPDCYQVITRRGFIRTVCY
ncbi:MAG: hypothetical protein AB7K64_11295 [Variibacter sp.]